MQIAKDLVRIKMYATPKKICQEADEKTVFCSKDRFKRSELSKSFRHSPVNSIDLNCQTATLP